MQWKHTLIIKLVHGTTHKRVILRGKNMIAKVEVRKQLALYEHEIKKEKQAVADELARMRDACLTVEMQAIFNQSKEYARLMAKLEVLSEVLADVRDIRCGEMLED